MKTNKKIINRIRNIKAFTLAEALVAVIIMLLVSAVVAAGIPAAMNAYEKVVITSNSQVLLSTTMSTLRNELLTAKNVKQKQESNNTEIIYDNEALGTKSRIFSAPSGDSANKEGTIMFQRYAGEQATTGPHAPVRLVSREASDKDMDLYVTFKTVSYDPTKKIIVFSMLEVKDKKNETRAKRDSYSIRVIAE